MMLAGGVGFAPAKRPVSLIGTRGSCKMATTVSLRKSYDVGYVNAGHGDDGCAGVMAYDTRSGEPPGRWHGNGADELAAARADKKDRPYASTVEIDQVCAEARAKSRPKSCRTPT
jgi:hypothetical protein